MEFKQKKINKENCCAVCRIVDSWWPICISSAEEAPGGTNSRSWVTLSSAGDLQSLKN
jgi:hypothetical protein